MKESHKAIKQHEKDQTSILPNEIWFYIISAINDIKTIGLISRFFSQLVGDVLESQRKWFNQMLTNLYELHPQWPIDSVIFQCPSGFQAPSSHLCSLFFWKDKGTINYFHPKIMEKSRILSPEEQDIFNAVIRAHVLQENSEKMDDQIAQKIWDAFTKEVKKYYIDLFKNVLIEQEMRRKTFTGSFLEKLKQEIEEIKKDPTLFYKRTFKEPYRFGSEQLAHMSLHILFVLAGINDPKRTLKSNQKDKLEMLLSCCMREKPFKKAEAQWISNFFSLLPIELVEFLDKIEKKERPITGIAYSAKLIRFDWFLPALKFFGEQAILETRFDSLPLTYFIHDTRFDSLSLPYSSPDSRLEQLNRINALAKQCKHYNLFWKQVLSLNLNQTVVSSRVEVNKEFVTSLCLFLEKLNEEGSDMLLGLEVLHDLLVEKQMPFKGVKKTFGQFPCSVLLTSDDGYQLMKNLMYSSCEVREYIYTNFLIPAGVDSLYSGNLLTFNTAVQESIKWIMNLYYYNRMQQQAIDQNNGHEFFPVSNSDSTTTEVQKSQTNLGL